MMFGVESIDYSLPLSQQQFIKFSRIVMKYILPLSCLIPIILLSSPYLFPAFILPSSCLISILSQSYSYLILLSFLYSFYFIPMLSFYQTEDHNDIIPFLRACYRKKILPAKNVLFMHFDAHPDLAVPSTTSVEVVL